jgi:chromosome segregation ATPase
MANRTRREIIGKIEEITVAIQHDEDTIALIKAELEKTTFSQATEDAHTRLKAAEEAFENARGNMHEQNQRTFKIRAQRADAFRMLEKLEEAEFNLETMLKNSAYKTEYAHITQQLANVQAKMKEQEGIKQDAEQLLATNTDFHNAIVALQKAEQEMHCARDAFDTAAIDEMATTQEHRERLRKSLTDLLQSQEKLNEHVTHLKQELKRLTA